MKYNLEPWMPQLGPGDSIGNYQIVELLQVGGLGCVYIVRPKDLQNAPLWRLRAWLRWYGLSETLVRRHELGALKIAGPGHEANLFDEQRYMTRFHHAHLVQAYQRSTERSISLLRSKEDRPVQTISLPDQSGANRVYMYIVMRMESGGTLDRLLRQSLRPWSTTGHPLKPKQAVVIARQLAQALDYLHTQQQVVHQDITPKNIVFRQRLSQWRWSKVHAVLIDIGILESLDHTIRLRPQTFGTKFFVAPECLKHAAPSVASDIYSLGMVLYVMLMGKHKGNYADNTSTKEWTAPRQLPASIPPRLTELVQRCIEPNPEQRRAYFPSMRQVVKQLEAIEAELGGKHYLRLPWPWKSKLAALLSSLVAFGLAWALYTPVSPPQNGRTIPTITVLPAAQAPTVAPTLVRPTPPALPTSTRLPRPDLTPSLTVEP